MTFGSTRRFPFRFRDDHSAGFVDMFNARATNPGARLPIIDNRGSRLAIGGSVGSV
jgi:hypothetical protein